MMFLNLDSDLISFPLEKSTFYATWMRLPNRCLPLDLLFEIWALFFGKVDWKKLFERVAVGIVQHTVQSLIRLKLG